MKENILEFIHRRFPEDTGTWTNGNCYWLAFILKEAFNCNIYYLPIGGHFVAKDDEDNYYDYTGIVYPEKPIIEFAKLKEEDIEWYNRLIRDCVM